jgi:murein DD-endopeptidase MepM/ murein hydrolase activator NlpD
VYHTIYAHLSRIDVQVDQNVAAGDLIGLADNTGNSFGSHLHLTLKIDGEQTQATRRDRGPASLPARRGI